MDLELSINTYTIQALHKTILIVCGILWIKVKYFVNIFQRKDKKLFTYIFIKFN